MNDRFVNLPALTNPLELYKVPRCGPLSDRNVCSFPKNGFICGRAKADRMMMVPSECPTKLILAGSLEFWMWVRIS